MPTVIAKQTFSPTSNIPQISVLKFDGSYAQFVDEEGVETGDYLELDKRAKELQTATGITHYAKIVNLAQMQPVEKPQPKLSFTH